MGYVYFIAEGIPTNMNVWRSNNRIAQNQLNKYDGINIAKSLLGAPDHSYNLRSGVVMEEVYTFAFTSAFSFFCNACGTYSNCFVYRSVVTVQPAV